MTGSGRRGGGSLGWTAISRAGPRTPAAPWHSTACPAPAVTLLGDVGGCGEGRGPRPCRLPQPADPAPEHGVWESSFSQGVRPGTRRPCTLWARERRWGEVDLQDPWLLVQGAPPRGAWTAPCAPVASSLPGIRAVCPGLTPLPGSPTAGTHLHAHTALIHPGRVHRPARGHGPRGGCASTQPAGASTARFTGSRAWAGAEPGACWNRLPCAPATPRGAWPSDSERVVGAGQGRSVVER